MFTAEQRDNIGAVLRNLLSPPITLSGFDFPVVNERAVRASAGLLLLFGITSWFQLLYTGDISLMRAFSLIFTAELGIRVLLGVRWAPFMIAGSLLTRKQSAEWTELRPKETAWVIGMLYSSIVCFGLAWIPGLTLAALLAACGVCLVLLFFESAIGFCLGCWIHSRFTKTPPQLCASGSCAAPARRNL